MAFPSVVTSQTATALAVSSLTITKPTGLAVGDLMVACIASSDLVANSRTFTTPSGWTDIQKGASNGCRIYAAWKIATSGDVAASNFTFSMSGSVTAMSGVLARVTGHTPASPNPVTQSEIDSNATTGGTGRTYTTAVTPESTESLAFLLVANETNNMTNSPATVSSYTSTPSITWTELADLGIKNASDDGHAFGVATGTYAGLTQITSRGATLSETMNLSDSSILFLVNGIVDVTGTNAVFSVLPTFFNQNGVAGTSGTSALHQTNPNFPAQSGAGTSPTQWVNGDKPSETSWANTNK